MSDALISLIPIYGPWIIFGIVAFESAGVPLPGETILIAAALLAATTGQINIVVDCRGRHGIHGRASARFALSSQIRSVHPPR